MPLYFINFSENGVIKTDECGVEFDCLEHAYLDVCRSALELSFERLRGRDDPHCDSAEILDADRRSLMQVPFSDVLHPRPSRELIARTATSASPIVDCCQKEVVRNQRLKMEIHEELKTTQAALDAIRISLRRSRQFPL